MMMKKKTNFAEYFHSFIFDNTGYKVVALCVSLVLWITILGRKNIIQTHEVDLQVLLAPKHALVNDIVRKVKVKLSGPRMGLKKYTQSEDTLTMDLSRLPVGRSIVRLNKDGLNLPLGVKVVDIDPKEIRVRIKEVIPSEEKNKK